MKIWILALTLCLILLPGCQPTQASPTPKPTYPPLDCQTSGSLQSLSLESATLGYSYAYRLYLPPCFNPASETGYPILYLVPGRGSGPAAWFTANIHQLADELTLAGEIEPFLIVATDNTDSDPQATVILQDLYPAIEQDHPVRVGRRYHAVAGASLGGIAAYRMALSRPDLFSSAAVFGSGMFSGEEAQVEAWIQALQPGQELNFFFNAGEQDPLMLERARALEALLARHNIPSTLLVDNGAHDYDSWARNFPAYLRWLSAHWRNSE